MIKVQILMSTYNGEAYLREQMDSILAQKTILGKEKIAISLLIRDDGSKDNTIKILEEYKKRFSQISYIKGENIGACKSFFKLMQKVEKEMDYIAFSDQDDVWKENKIKRAISGLKKYDTIPAMYASDLEIVNYNLELIKVSNNTSKHFYPSFGNALIENICTGCTIVINKKLYDMVVKTVPRYAYMHDWWLYMTASCFGKVLYDKKAWIKYRQHKENTVGSAVKYWKLMEKRIRNFHLLQKYVPLQIKEFIEIFELPEDKRKLAEQMIISDKDFKKKLKIFKYREIKRRKVMDTLLYKFGYFFW